MGGDEFVAICQRHDYEQIDELLKELELCNINNSKTGAVQVAFGMSKFENDNSVVDVFERADHLMYERKARMKAESSGQ